MTKKIFRSILTVGVAVLAILNALRAMHEAV